MDEGTSGEERGWSAFPVIWTDESRWPGEREGEGEGDQAVSVHQQGKLAKAMGS